MLCYYAIFDEDSLFNPRTRWPAGINITQATKTWMDGGSHACLLAYEVSLAS